jgi:TatD DNase family protein
MALKFVDTHSHLYSDEFKDDYISFIDSAMVSGVEHIILPNIDSTSFQAMMSLTSLKPTIFRPMMGLHPCSVKLETVEKELEQVKYHLDSRTFIGIGEIGMDLYWDHTTEDLQRQALITQCQWAAELNLPVALHTRNATKQVIAVIKKLNRPELTGIFHCFGDGLAEAEEIVEMGFKLGIGGVLTFKNSGLNEVIRSIDLQHLVLETDSPYLAPVPHRGKRNESSYLPIIAQKLADVKETTLAEVAQITTKNAIELFRI